MTVRMIMYGLCRLFSISMPTALFLMLWQFMKMPGSLVSSSVYMCFLVVLLLIVSFEL